MPQERPMFFELGDDRLFGVLHLPEGKPRHGIVLCHALAEEKLWSHRVFVGLARELSRRGIAVLRFDFRGEGESDLEFEQAGITSRVDDAVRAAEVLLAEAPSLPGVVLLGHRLGGAIAAAAAARIGPTAQGLIVWDPVRSGRDYLMQLLRSNLARQIAEQGKAPRTRQALIEALEAGDTVVVDGYGLCSPLYRELVALEWPPLLDVLECPALFIAPDEAARKAVQPRAESAGRPAVDVAAAAEPAFWREAKHLHRGAPNMAEVSVRWLERQGAEALL